MTRPTRSHSKIGRGVLLAATALLFPSPAAAHHHGEAETFSEMLLYGLEHAVESPFVTLLVFAGVAVLGVVWLRRRRGPVEENVVG